MPEETANITSVNSMEAVHMSTVKNGYQAFCSHKTGFECQVTQTSLLYLAAVLSTSIGIVVAAIVCICIFLSVRRACGSDKNQHKKIQSTDFSHIRDNRIKPLEFRKQLAELCSSKLLNATRQVTRKYAAKAKISHRLERIGKRKTTGRGKNSICFKDPNEGYVSQKSVSFPGPLKNLGPKVDGVLNLRNHKETGEGKTQIIYQPHIKISKIEQGSRRNVSFFDFGNQSAIPISDICFTKGEPTQTTSDKIASQEVVEGERSHFGHIQNSDYMVDQAGQHAASKVYTPQESINLEFSDCTVNSPRDSLQQGTSTKSCALESHETHNLERSHRAMSDLRQNFEFSEQLKQERKKSQSSDLLETVDKTSCDCDVDNSSLSEMPMIVSACEYSTFYPGLLVGDSPDTNFFAQLVETL